MSIKQCEKFVLILIIVNIIILFFETIPSLPQIVTRMFHWIELISIMIFSFEIVVRLFIYKGKKKSVSFWIFLIIDFAAVIFFYIPVSFDARMLRIFRVIKALKITRHSKSIKKFVEVLTVKRNELLSCLGIIFFFIFFSAMFIYYFEHEKQPENFSNMFSALWWSVVTLTTVGYGDIYPVTVGGKILTSFISLLGIGVIALPTGIIAAGFVEKK